MTWGLLRPRLLADLGFATPQDLAEAIDYPDVAEIHTALAGGYLSDDLMNALMPYYLILPPLYFVRRAAA